MPELSEVETMGDDTQARRWGRAEWGPFVLLAGYLIVIIIWNPIGDSSASMTSHWPIAFIGAMLCISLQCAFWTTWSPHPLKWRVPLGSTACLFLGMAMGAKDSDPSGLAISFSLFLVFCVGFSIARMFGSWRLFLTSESPPMGGINDGRQFSVRYLLAWTTVCALLLTLGRFVFYESDPSNQPPMEWVLFLLATTAIFILALLPIIGIGLIILRHKRRAILFGLVALPLGIAISSLVMAYAMIELSPSPPSSTFRGVWEQMVYFSTGATLSMFLTALVLRYSGYRITRDNKATV